MLVIGDLDVEVFEELGELRRLVIGERVAQVRNRSEHRLDRVGMDVARRPRLERGEVAFESVALGGQLDDPPLGERDDGMGGIVVLFHAEGLAVKGAVELGQLPSAPGDLCFVLVPAAC